MAEADNRKRTLFTQSADKTSDYLKQFEKEQNGVDKEKQDQVSSADKARREAQGIA
jgi:hypothetical protein